MPVLKQNSVFAGRYLLEVLIGEGGFSEVWMAKDQMADDALVAIKIYAPDRGLDEWGLKQFKNEFSLTHNLSHPHLLKVNHFDVADGSPYLIMTYCPYGSLGEVLRKGRIFSERQVALVMCQIGSALEEIHRQEPAIIHQDIKPDNILLMQPEMFMLADFGISSRIRNTLSKTTVNRQALTVAYAPPERFDRHPSADAASDIFSLGVTLYEMCTNALPWEGAGGQCLLKGARIPALPAGFSTGLSKILEACMSADSSKRPTAAEIYQKSRLYLETGEWQVASRKRKLLYMNKVLVSSVVTVAVALAAIAGAVFYDLEVDKLPEESVEISTALVVAAKPEAAVKGPAVAEKAAVEKKRPAPEEVRVSPKQEGSNRLETAESKPIAPLKQATHASKKQTPVQQKRVQDVALRKKAQTSEEQLVEEAMLDEDTSEVPVIEKQPAPAHTKPAVVTRKQLPKQTETKAVSQTSKSSAVKVNRPSTSNTTITKAKKSWFNATPKSKTVRKKNPHKKRVRKLKRRFS